MKAKHRHDFLGSLLVREGVITQAQLDDALEHANSNGEPALLGRTLVKLGHCSEEAISRAVARRAGVPFMSLEDIKVDAAATATVSPEATRRYQALPLAFNGDRLVVAMQHPTDIVALDDLRILTGLDIDPVVIPDSELEMALNQYSQTAAGVEHSAEEEAEESAFTATDTDSEKPAVQLANVILNQSVAAKASDVHIEPYEKSLRVRFRIDGVLHDMMQPPRRLHASLVSRIKVMANMDIAERRIPQDGRTTLRIDGKTIDVRIATLPVAAGERVTMRLLNRSANIITLEQLGVEPDMLERYQEVITLPYGFILVTGPTGSGKSTTLYASLAAVDKKEKNVITLEDPVEYRMNDINQIQINPKAGLTFASGLRSILRSDPDIVMVGEIRDKETARIAIESALTGHLVFSTLHTNDAAATISRLAEMDIEPYLTASSLICVLAQRLARVLCPNCRVEHVVSREEAEAIPDFPLEPGEQRIVLHRPNPAGCVRCSGTGYKGRTGVYELLFASERIQRLTLERRSSREIKEVAMSEGMKTLRQDGMRKVRQGITSIEEVMRVVL